MKKVFYEVTTLDQYCYDTYHLSEDLLMEHAALGLKSAIPKEAKSILIVSGPGNNGADGIALARMLQGAMDVALFLPMGVKSDIALKQLARTEAVGVTTVDRIDKAYDVIVDAIFGSGLSKPLDGQTSILIDKLNSMQGVKIACDLSTGIHLDGKIPGAVFTADITVTMGALKEALYSDNAKDHVGKIQCVDLGVSTSLYEKETNTFLLQKKDMRLPHRLKQNSHKGHFGHLSVVAGKKQGAAVLAAEAAYAFGAGLVTVVENEPYSVPPELMSSTTLPHSNNAVCIGMGLGNQFDNSCLKNFLLDHHDPIVIDADLFYNEILIDVLNTQKNLVLTPHPKEFVSLLKMTGIADVSVEEVQQNRFGYIRKFSEKYPDAVLLLKGANTLISQNSTVYIQRFGTNVLSKGGSGDVLGGLIGALLAQGYAPLDAAITGSLAHAFSARNFKHNSYALTPLDIIEGVKCL